MFRIRLLSGTILGALVLGLLWMDERSAQADPASTSPGFLVLVMLAVSAAGGEYFRMARLAGARPFPLLGLVLINALIVAGWWLGWALYRGPEPRTIHTVQAALLGFGAAAALGSVFVAQGLRGGPQAAVINISTTVLGVAYLGGVSIFFFLFRFAVGSIWTFLIALAVVKMTDSGAYGVGRLCGRHKLTWISPGKTWEGLFGGLATALLLGALLGALHEHVPWLPIGKSVVFSLAIGAVGQLGDLAKSILKRDVGLKDSGSIIPGMGGALDVIDSPLAAAPVAYLLWIALQAG
jgi:phosphatidate cytidylyltransferase